MKLRFTRLYPAVPRGEPATTEAYRGHCARTNLSTGALHFALVCINFTVVGFN